VDPLSPTFQVLREDAPGGPRVGRLDTAHGALETPAFLPVGTYGAVRGITPDELSAVGVQGVLANTYHLHLRPGEATVAALGGLHGFMGWPGPILTDSGGFQIHSLDHLCERSEAGVRFRNPWDGSRVSLEPEGCIAIQESLGADLVVTLDEFEPISEAATRGEQGEAERDRVREPMERTLRWAARCRSAHRRADQLLFGIVQGGGFEDLRRESAERTAALGFDAFALGGLGVGEPAALRSRLVEATVPALPGAAPRYLMGLGMPGDLVEAVARGVDLFDCVVPTRHGRHGNVFTRRGRLNLRNARFREDADPIERDCGCPACRSYSRGYLRHLIEAKELLAPRLLSLHNLAYYMRLMRELREAIAGGDFEAWRTAWSESYSEPASAATDSAA
jgi:queuine tRNA-ribosyltransferase